MPGPGLHQRRRLHGFFGRAEVTQRDVLTGRVVDEGFAAGRLEQRPRLRVDLEEQAVVADQGHEDVVDVEAVAAEHAAHAHAAQWREQLGAMGDELR
jgi:hypothetical protein